VSKKYNIYILKRTGINMEFITACGKWLGILAGIIVSLGIISTPVAWLIKKMLEITKNLKSLNDWNLRQQQDIEEGAEEHQIIMESILAALRGLSEQGCNGPVSRGIENLEAYMLNKSHRLRSKKDTKGATI
jgi:hypothetical protein